jgi:hypothetical protein
LFGLCVSAEPAAVFEFFPVLPLRKTFEAAAPAFFPVFSFLAIELYLLEDKTTVFSKCSL